MATTPTFNRPDNIHSAMQYNDTTGKPELRVNLGSDAITITGSVNVGTVVEVASTPDNPVHTHVSEVGTSGVLNVPYLPVGILDVTGNPNGIAHPLFVDLVEGTISVEQSGPWTTSVTGSVNIGNFPTNQAVTISNTPTVNQGTSPWVVSGAVSVSNFPATQPVSGSVTVSNFPATQPVSGNVTVSGAVSVSNFPATQPVTGTFWQATQPVSGTVSVGNFPATQPVSGTVTVNQGTSPWIVKDTATDLIVADSDYEMNIARGLLAGQAIVTRNGYNPDVSQNIETSIWVQGGLYPFASWTVASPLYVASNDILDVGQNVFIEGLDSNYDLQTEVIMLNGTAVITSTKTWMRIHSATITSSSSITSNAGDILFRITSGSGAVVAHMAPGLGMTKLSQYTVPRNKTGYILFGDATSFRSGSGNIGTQIRMYVRQYNGPFVGVHVAEVVNGHYRNDFNVPLAIPARGDVDVRCFADANNTIITCNYQLILVDN